MTVGLLVGQLWQAPRPHLDPTRCRLTAIVPNLFVSSNNTFMVEYVLMEDDRFLVRIDSHGR